MARHTDSLAHRIICGGVACGGVAALLGIVGWSLVSTFIGQMGLTPGRFIISGWVAGLAGYLGSAAGRGALTRPHQATNLRMLLQTVTMLLLLDFACGGFLGLVVAPRPDHGKIPPAVVYGALGLAIVGTAFLGGGIIGRLDGARPLGATSRGLSSDRSVDWPLPLGIGLGYTLLARSTCSPHGDCLDFGPWQMLEIISPIALIIGAYSSLVTWNALRVGLLFRLLRRELVAG